MKPLKACVAEMIGTFYLCFAGIAAILSTQSPINSGAGLVGIALAHGLALSIAVSVFGGISGAHVNPAVTIAMLVTGRIRPTLAGGYVFAQLLGATLAAMACSAIFPAVAVQSANLGIPLPANWGGSWSQTPPWITPQKVILVEAILTFLLVTSVFGAAVDERGKGVKIGGFAIGLTVAFDILAGGPITGASMNPARSFGPALVYADWSVFRDTQWCYWVGPIAGGIVAGLLYHHFLLDKEPPLPVEPVRKEPGVRQS
jgi:aquaporin Z